MLIVPAYVYVVFAASALATLLLFFKAGGFDKRFIVIVSIWVILQLVLGISGFYAVTDKLPRFPLLVIPPVLFILGSFFTVDGRRFVDQLQLKWLTWLHVVRVPVEITLLWLFLHHAVPQLMTFEGRNFDIVSGITAPVIGWLAFRGGSVNKTLLLVWNIICLLLLMNVVVNALLSVPGPLQKQAFDQPNIAVLCFPFNLLPSVVVPLVLFAHLAAIRQLVVRRH